MKTRSVLMFLIGWMCFLCSAKTEQDPVQLDLTFSTLPLEGEDWQGIFYAPNGNPSSGLTSVIFNRLERSPSYEYKGPSPIRFYRKVPQPDGSETLTLVAAHPVPEPGATVPLLLFFFLPEEDQSQYRIQSMQDTEDTFPNHSIVFFNTMRIPLKGVLGREAVTIPPGPSRAMDVTDYFGGQVPIAFAINHENDLRLVLKNKITFFPDQKTLLILRKPRRRNSLRIRTQRIVEFTGARPPEEKEGEEGEEDESDDGEE